MTQLPVTTITRNASQDALTDADYLAIIDSLRRQRDELLQVLREVREWRGDKPDWLHVVVDEALAKYDAVTGVTQEDSDE